MDKNPPGKSISFNDRHSPPRDKSLLLNKSFSFSVHRRHPPPPLPQRTFSSINAVWNLRTNKNGSDNVEDAGHQPTLDEVSIEIDGLIKTLEEKSNLSEIPQSIETFTMMVQSEMDKYDSPESISSLKFGHDLKHDTLLINAITWISKLTNSLVKFSPEEKVSSSLSLTTLVIQRAMTFMEEELRILLEDSVNPPSLDSKSTPKSSKHNSETQVDDQTSRIRDEDEYEEESDGKSSLLLYPGISEEEISKMRRIASTMISAGYETECCQVYSILRRKAFKEAMKRQGLEKVSMDEVQKMEWEILEGHITKWIKVVKHVAKVLLPGEKRLCNAVFSEEHLSIGVAMITNLARSVVILFLNFAEAIAMTKRSAERLFKVLDIYETLTELMATLDDTMCSQECANELRSEILSVRRRLGEAAVCIFCDLENSIKNDAARNPVPGGAVHPLTRYTMNYLRYTCDFKETLEQVFSLNQQTQIQIAEQLVEALEQNKDHNADSNDAASNKSVGGERAPKQTPFAAQLMKIMELLDANLEAKSMLYKDPSLRYIFLMNNGRYILQKIKESTEFHGLVGDQFKRKRSSELRGYHKNYQRESWRRVLQCLNQEGLQVNGKVQKPVLKERFKNFNQMFDEIHKTQSSWVVSDEQLQSELRVSISAVMIPAYRSFLARFGQYFTPRRQSEKYIKYQPEDIESTIEALFDGNQNLSMARRKN